MKCGSILKACDLFLAGAVFLAASNSVSAAYTCTGPVVGLTINPLNGVVQPQQVAGLQWPTMCSVETVANGVSTETCKNIYAMLLSAQATGKDVMLWFNDGGDCSSASHPAWQPLQGWYFGPQIQ